MEEHSLEVILSPEDLVRDKVQAAASKNSNGRHFIMCEFRPHTGASASK